MNNLRTITVKTQVRRLKYFSSFVDILKGNGLPKQILSQKALRWSAENHEDLKKYFSPTGEIILKNGKVISRSFQNYLDAAVRFKILYEEGDYIKTTRLGKVLESIRPFSALNGLIPNVFQLTTIEQIFFLYLILYYDADLFLTLQEILLENPGKHLGFYIKNFQEYYLKRLKTKINFVSLVEKAKIAQSIQRVIKWRREKRCCEDIVPSRMNWLLDLNMLVEGLYIEERKYRLNVLGEKMYKSFTNLNGNLKDIDDSWINKEMPQSLGLFFSHDNLTSWDRLSINDKENLLKEPLFYARENFSSLHLPRISLSQVLLFISLYLLSRHKVQVTFNDINEFIGFEKKIKDIKFGIRKAARPEESYLLITNG